MAWKETHKLETRQRILGAAADLFTRKGFNLVGIDEVMLAAGLTRGAFYAHFSSKIDLYEAAIISAAISAAERINEQGKDLNSAIANYLSADHLHSEDVRCPMACLVSDVAHDDQRVQEIYTRLFKGFTKHLQQLADETTSEDQTLVQSVLMIGGLALARSLTDKKLAEKILLLSKNTAQNLTANALKE